MRRAPGPLSLALVLSLLAVAPLSASAVRITWEPPEPRAGDVVLMRVHGAAPDAMVEAALDGRPLGVFPTADGHAALAGIDMDTPAGPRSWRVSVAATTAEGKLPVIARRYHVERLTVAPSMSELDPATERRAVQEAERLRVLYRTVTGERLWRGPFMRPVSGDRPGTGFGSRRVINGHPRAPHSGIDFPAAAGTPVLAANRGRVALVADFFFPGRLVILDHGLGLHTLYFHLDTIAVSEGQVVARGETLGTVGMTGRVTGPHLHFGAQVGAARVDPAVLLGFRADRVPD